MRYLASLLFTCLLTLTTQAAPQALLTLDRAAYQDNETIDLAVVRSGDEALAMGELTLTIAGPGEQARRYIFPAAAVPLADGEARTTEHLRLDARLLAPGQYTATVEVDGATAAATFAVYSHLRQSSFRLINWGSSAKLEQHHAQGAHDLGYNLVMQNSGREQDEALIRAGVDRTSCCGMGGGHQLNLRHECDWSDPYALRGGRRTASWWALQHRLAPNAIGVHHYDEPGLTWNEHAETGEFTPHMIASQVRSFEAAFGEAPLEYHLVDPANPEHVARWKHWARWKLGFMDAAWADAAFAVKHVQPDFISFVQSQYGWTAFTDGYYFNVARSQDVVSGHGGYHDLPLGYYMPSFTLEAAIARDRDRDIWYLPLWYGNSTAEHVRIEQYMSFQTGIQGLATPPPLDPASGRKLQEGVVEAIRETNHAMARLGTIFTTMQPAPAEVAALYSLSHQIELQTQDRAHMYAHSEAHVQHLYALYLAAKQVQQPIDFIVEEDVLDGTLMARHKALVLMSVDYLPAAVIARLEAFVAQGGAVLTSSDSAVSIAGAIDLGQPPALPGEEELAEVNTSFAAVMAEIRQLGQSIQTKRKANEDVAAEQQQQAQLRTQLEALGNRRQALSGMRPRLQVAQALGTRLRQTLDGIGIAPVIVTDAPGISATRQAEGEIAYTFALNASHDFASDDPHLSSTAVTASLSLPDDGRPLYDALNGGPYAGLSAANGRLAGTYEMAPGELRVFARTARPIGALRVSTPTLDRSYTRYDSPIVLTATATLLDEAGGILAGSAPLQIRLLAPDGSTRYDLYRATHDGVLQISLPLGETDPAGAWTLQVRELLANHEGSAGFTFAPNAYAAAAGELPRALFFAADRHNLFRFFRLHQEIAIVTGSSDYTQAQAERLRDSLAPWGVRATIVSAESVNKSRVIPEEGARTWSGITHTGRGAVKPGEGTNDPKLVGYAIYQPCILLGNAQDNPLIAYLSTSVRGASVLPYQPQPGIIPGRGRGMLAWQFDLLGRGIESIAVIAHDEAGLSEGIGSLYEIAAGLQPLTPSELPTGIAP